MNKFFLLLAACLLSGLALAAPVYTPKPDSKVAIVGLKAFNEFVSSGWAIGGQASAAAKAGDRGGSYQGAVAIADGIWLYQLTDAGLALELTVKGTKYYKDNDLN